ncbi:hypothetical protein LTS10_009321 [Elasticomyces elasticus]|nr:hypothetical protein LTS10_009321 [Elasticomyces elasticus]
MAQNPGFTPTAVHVHNPLAPIVERQEPGIQDDAQALFSSNAPVRKRKRVDLICTRCSESFTERRSLTRHETRGTAKCPRITETTKLELHVCPYPECGESFAQSYNRKRHEKEVHFGEKRSAPVAHISSQGDADRSVAIAQQVRAPEKSDVSCFHGAEGDSVASGAINAEDNAVGLVTPSASSAHHDSGKTDESSTLGRSSVSAGHDSAIELHERPYRDKHVPKSGATEQLVAETAVTDSPRTSSLLVTSGTCLHMASGEHEMADNYALPSDVMDIDWTLDLPEFHTISSPAEPGHGIAAYVADNESIRSASTKMSISSVRRQILHGTAKRAGSLVRGRGTRITKAQKCSMCGKPYEQDPDLLKEHLDAHLIQLHAEETWSTCRTCEIGFVREQDLCHHLRSARNESCCALPLGHEGACKGYRCGYNFSHSAPCNGHHPPTASDGTWSDHDRFRFGQFMRKWELLQLKTVIDEVKNVECARSIGAALDRFSLSEIRRFSQFSKNSLISSRSEPIKQQYDMASLQEKMLDLNLDGRSSTMLRTATLIMGTQPVVDRDLVHAAETNNVDLARRSLRRGARPDFALRIAIERDHPEIIAYLVQAGAHVDIHFLCDTMLARKSQAAKQLLAHHDARDLLPTYGAAMLSLAVRSDDTAAILMLLQAGTDVDAGPTNEEWMHFLTLNFRNFVGRARQDVQSHVASYFDWTFDRPSSYNDPPLCVAASLGHSSTLACLIESGADLSYTGSRGTALEIAVSERHEACIEALIDASAQTQAFDGAGNTLLDRAVLCRDARIVKLLLEASGHSGSMGIHALFTDGQSSPPEEVDIINLLLIHGADVNALDANGLTPLHRATLQGRTEVVEHLLQAGADPHCLSLHTALKMGTSSSLQFVPLLIIDGADVNGLDGDLRSPLQIASYGCHTEAFQQLLDAGADMDRIDVDKLISSISARTSGVAEFGERLNHLPDALARRCRDRPPGQFASRISPDGTERPSGNREAGESYGATPWFSKESSQFVPDQVALVANRGLGLEPQQQAELIPNLNDHGPETQQLAADLINTHNVHATGRQHGSFICDWCGETFTERRTLTRHQTYGTKQCPSRRREWCTYAGCGRAFARPDTRKRHEAEKHYGKQRSASELERVPGGPKAQPSALHSILDVPPEINASQASVLAVAPSKRTKPGATTANEPARPVVTFRRSNHRDLQDFETMVNGRSDPTVEVPLPPDPPADVCSDGLMWAEIASPSRMLDPGRTLSVASGIDPGHVCSSLCWGPGGTLEVPTIQPTNLNASRGSESWGVQDRDAEDNDSIPLTEPPRASNIVESLDSSAVVRSDLPLVVEAPASADPLPEVFQEWALWDDFACPSWRLPLDSDPFYDFSSMLNSDSPPTPIGVWGPFKQQSGLPDLEKITDLGSSPPSGLLVPGLELPMESRVPTVSQFLSTSHVGMSPMSLARPDSHSPLWSSPTPSPRPQPRGHTRTSGPISLHPAVVGKRIRDAVHPRYESVRREEMCETFDQLSLAHREAPASICTNTADPGAVDQPGSRSRLAASTKLRSAPRSPSGEVPSTGATGSRDDSAIGKEQTRASKFRSTFLVRWRSIVKIKWLTGDVRAAV